MTNEETIRPKVSYEQSEALVVAYRDHDDEDAAQGLLDAFEGYIVKYFNLVRRGRINLKDRDMREFVKLYMNNEYCRRNIHRYKYMPVVQQEIHTVCDRIRKICDAYSDDDLKHEIYIAMLTMAKRYAPPDDKPRFHTYILRAFHFQLRRQLQVLTSDPIAFKMVNFEKMAEGDYINGDGWEMQQSGLSESGKAYAFTIEDEFEEINDNWVLGFTNDMNYADLTIMERRIIKMYYIDEMSDQQIANQLGTCRATINRKRNRSKDSLRAHFEQQGKLTREGD